jgi:hypothetical protein
MKCGVSWCGAVWCVGVLDVGAVFYVVAVWCEVVPRMLKLWCGLVRCGVLVCWMWVRSFTWFSM